MKFIGLSGVLLVFCYVLISMQPIKNLPNEERIVNKILRNTADSVESKFDLRPCGMGAAMPHGVIKGLTLCFDTKKTENQEQMRIFIINAAKELLKCISENLEIEDYLENYPFTINNLSIIIYNYDINGITLPDPHIAVARLSDGKLIYKTIDPLNSLKFKNIYEESYEEALKKIKQDDTP